MGTCVATVSESISSSFQVASLNRGRCQPAGGQWRCLFPSSGGPQTSWNPSGVVLDWTLLTLPPTSVQQSVSLRMPPNMFSSCRQSLTGCFPHQTVGASEIPPPCNMEHTYVPSSLQMCFSWDRTWRLEWRLHVVQYLTSDNVWSHATLNQIQSVVISRVHQLSLFISSRESITRPMCDAAVRRLKVWFICNYKPS